MASQRGYQRESNKSEMTRLAAFDLVEDEDDASKKKRDDDADEE